MEKPDRGQLYAMTFVFNGMLLRAADNQRTVSIEAPTLSDALAELTTKYPEMKRILLDTTGQLRQAHKVCLNGEMISRPDSALPLSEDDRIELFTAISGG
ncbi:MoaD/ThiS family protein [Streptomyces sp. NPDC006703]|uniref:MoaD/ThiS family protein n=1 Tax=Streptomyces sp. NPDC006703 TaxID=3364759 RepID=UPI0036941225